MTRVLFYLPDLSGGGAQRTLLNLASAVAGIEGFEVHLVLGATEGPASKWIDPVLSRENLPSTRARKQVSALRKAIKCYEPDAVFSTMLHGNLVAWLATRFLTRQPALLLRETNSHEARTDLGTVQKVLAGLAYRAADRFIALSEGVRLEMLRLYRLSSDKTVTIHNPVNLAPYEAKIVSKQVAGTSSKTFRIVTIGRLVDQKNHRLLLDALSRMNCSGLSVSILGEGPLRQALEAYSDELGLSDIVSFHGFVPDPEIWLARSDLFVLSSRYEGFGHVLIEAMAAQLPVISTDCPYGPADIIDHEKTGLLVPNLDAQELALAIERVWRDPDLRRSLAEKGKARAEDFSVSVISHRYAEEIMKTVSEKSQCAE